MPTRRHATHSFVIPTLCLLLVAASACVAAAATAEAVVYEGHVKGLPATQFDLTVKRSDGRRIVQRLDYDEVPVTCDNGPDAHNGFNNYFSGNRVRDGAFDIRTDDPGFFTRLVGELKRGGRVVGTYKQRVDFGPPEGICKTGTVEWVARRP